MATDPRKQPRRRPPPCCEICGILLPLTRKSLDNVPEHSHQFEYVDEKTADEEFIDPITSAPLFDPQQLPCGHCFSKDELDRCLKISEQCPVCRRPVKLNDVRDVPLAMRNVLNRLAVTCPHCSSEMPRGGLREHLSRCDYTPVFCPNNCRRKPFAREQLESHEEVCPLSNVSCKIVGCDHSCFRRDMDDHLSKCEHVVVKCDQHCGKSGKRLQLAKHKRAHCSQTKVQCDIYYEDTRCSFVSPRCLMSEHREECSLLPVECEGKCGVKMCKRDAVDHNCVAYLASRPQHTEERLKAAESTIIKLTEILDNDESTLESEEDLDG